MAIMIDVKGTSQTVFQIGKGNAKIKSTDAYGIYIRNATDTDYASLKCGTISIYGAWANIMFNAGATYVGADQPYQISRPTTGMTASVNLYLPPTNGTGGQVLSNNGAGITTWITPALSGGTLASGQIIIGSASNIATAITPFGQATISNFGVITLDNASVIGKLITGYTPITGNVLATDSILTAIRKLAGNATAAATSILGITTRHTYTTFWNSAYDAVAFTVPANAVIENVEVIIDIPFDDPTATLQIIATTPTFEVLMGATQNNLASLIHDCYESNPGIAAVASTRFIHVQYYAGASTVGQARVILTWSIPA